jgi:hypothetical protein
MREKVKRGDESQLGEKKERESERIGETEYKKIKVRKKLIKS